MSLLRTRAPLVPCESCRRHVRSSDETCPFCKTTRTTSKLAIVAIGSALALAGCDVVTGGAKYGGPPPNMRPEPAMVDASDNNSAADGSMGTVSPSPSDSTALAPSPTPSPSSSSSSSPRLNPTASTTERVHAPATKYGLAPKPLKPPQTF